MEFLWRIDEATRILLEPPDPQPNGRIIRMGLNHFIEIISSFRQTNRVHKCSVATECMNYSELLSQGTVAECAQQTLVETSPVACQTLDIPGQTEAANARRLSGIAYPVQRSTVSVTTSKDTRAPQSESHNNGAIPTKGKASDGENDRKMMEVVCRHVSILKDFVRTIHRNQPSDLHEFVVLFADHLSQFCSEVKDSAGHDSVDVLKQFQSNVEKDFASKELWSMALKSDALTFKHRKRDGSRYSVEKQPRDTHSHRQHGSKRTAIHLKPLEHSPSKSRRSSSYKRPRDEEYRSISSKLAKDSAQSKDKHSDKSDNSSVKYVASSRRHGSASSSKRYMDLDDEIRQTKKYRDHRQRINSTTDSPARSGKGTRKVGCFKSSKLNDPRLSHSREKEEDIDAPPTDADFDLRSLITPKSNGQKSELLSDAAVGSPLPNARPRISNRVESKTPSQTGTAMAKTPTGVPVPSEPTRMLISDEASSQQMGIAASDVRKYTMNEAATVLTNFCKNYPYVEQPKMPSPKLANICRKTENSVTGNSNVEVICKTSKPVKIDGPVSTTLKPDKNEVKLPLQMKPDKNEVKLPLQIPCDPTSVTTVTGDNTPRPDKASNFDGVAITPSLTMPIKKEAELHEDSVNSRGSIMIKDKEDRVEPDQELVERVYARASYSSTKEHTKDLIPDGSSGNAKNSERLQTFCIGSVRKWCNAATTTNPQETRPETPKYSPISTQITPRRDESKHDPYYQDDAEYASESQSRTPTTPMSSNCLPTDQYHSPSFQSFGGVKDSMPNYGSFYRE